MTARAWQLSQLVSVEVRTPLEDDSGSLVSVLAPCLRPQLKGLLVDGVLRLK